MAGTRTDGVLVGFTALCAALLLSFCRDAGEAYRQISDSGKSAAFQNKLSSHTTLTSELRTAVARRSMTLEAFLKSPHFAAFAKSRNDNQTTLTSEQIKLLDTSWAQGTSDIALLDGISNNECSKALKEFRGNNPSFAEIFITDTRGLNICQTNKTSDYYQADEAWWIDGFAGGSGKSGFGSIEFDESARMESIEVHMPLYDGQSHEVLGIAKGVLNLTRILAEL